MAQKNDTFVSFSNTNKYTHLQGFLKAFYRLKLTIINIC
jgi:hypothetical protein